MNILDYLGQTEVFEENELQLVATALSYIQQKSETINLYDIKIYQMDNTNVLKNHLKYQNEHYEYVTKITLNNKAIYLYRNNKYWLIVYIKGHI